MFRRVAAAILAAALVPAAAQLNNNASKPTVRIDVNLIQVDAIVTDAKGKSIVDLKASDFQVSVDGKSQIISDCTYVHSERALADPSASQPGRLSDQNSTSVRPANTVALQPGNIRQTVAFAVDDLGLAAESVPLVRAALKKFVAEQLQPGDLAAVFHTSAFHGTPLFTTNAGILSEAASKMTFTSTGRNGGNSISPIKGPHGVFTEGEPQQRQAMSTLQTLNCLHDAVNALAGMPGRRSIVLFSENLQTVFSGDRPDRLAQSAFQQVVETANRASVAIYTIDPRGEVNDFATAADEFHRIGGPSQINVIQLQRGRAIDQSRDGLALLSEQTGGVFFQNTNNLAGALNKARDDSAGYYLIGIYPDPQLLQDSDRNSRFHSIKVRALRPGLRARSRKGSFELETPSSNTVGFEPERMTQALHSPFAHDGVHVRLTSLYTGNQSGPYVINSLVQVESRDLKLVEDSAHARSAAIHIRELVLNSEGNTVGSADAAFPLYIEARDFETNPPQAMIYSVRHIVNKPGHYQVRVAVEDGTPGKLGTAGEVVDIPNISGGEFALSSLLLQGQAATLTLSPAVDTISRLSTPNANESAAVRIFKPGTTIGYGCLIFNSPSTGNGQLTVETETRIYQGGREVYASKREPLKIGSQADPNHVEGRWTLRLGETLKPGNYVLELTAFNGLSNKKQRAAVQTVDFTVR